jgi:lipase chaperone LimK
VNTRLILGGGLLLVAALATIYFLRPEPTAQPPAPSTTAVTTATSTRASNTAANGNASAATTAVIQGTTPADTFKFDGEGQLVLNADTRTRIEALLQHNTSERLPAVKSALAQSLPKDAAEEAAELLDRYREYQTAARELYAPRTGEVTQEEQLEMLENLHELRVEHLGIDAAEGFFAADEADARARLARQEPVPELIAPEEARPDPTSTEATDPNVVIPPQ